MFSFRLLLRLASVLVTLKNHSFALAQTSPELSPSAVLKRSHCHHNGSNFYGRPGPTAFASNQCLMHRKIPSRCQSSRSNVNGCRHAKTDITDITATCSTRNRVHAISRSPRSFLPYCTRQTHRRVPSFSLFKSLAPNNQNSIELFASFADADADTKSNDDESLNLDSKFTTEAPPPPRYLAIGYNIASLLNIIAALGLIFNAPTSFTTSASTSTTAATASVTATVTATAASVSRYQPNILATYFAGCLGHLFLAGGTCNILADSVRSKRLFTSGTYKRLTLGTLLFGLGGIFSIPGEVGCKSSLVPSTFGFIFGSAFLAKLVTLVVSFMGWEYGANGFGRGDAPSNLSMTSTSFTSTVTKILLSFKYRTRNIVREIGKGCQNVWKTMPVTDERPATFYRTFFIFVTMGNLVFNIPELYFVLQQKVGLISLPLSLIMSSISRLALLSCILYVLKDAAERQRLEGSTFIKLNMMVGLWALGVGIAQGVADGPIEHFNIRRAADKLFFSLVFLTNGINSQLIKMGIVTKRDENDPDADPPLRVKLF